PLCLLLVTHGRPLLHAPFPYTTLFRSAPFIGQSERLPSAKERPAASRPPSRIGRQPRLGVTRQPSPHSTARSSVATRSRTSPSPDRKSTRLNSSHVKKSYPVCCL